MIVLVILFWVSISALAIVIALAKGSNDQRPPNMMVGHNGIESHHDFLEMHGFITAEEREAQRDLEREIKEFPERFKTMDLKQFLEEYKE